MPFCKTDAGLLYFAHVPKCAGTSVEIYLEQRFGALAFADREYLSVPPDQRWPRSSPQHISVTSLTRLIPASFFDHVFTVVRHPVNRVISVFQFQQENENLISNEMCFSEWLCEIEKRRNEFPFVWDNHIRPMNELVPERAKVFKLEAGLAPVTRWLDELDPKTASMREIPVHNTRQQRLDWLKLAGEPANVSDDDKARIRAIYAVDFRRFGYE